MGERKITGVGPKKRSTNKGGEGGEGLSTTEKGRWVTIQLGQRVKGKGWLENRGQRGSRETGVKKVSLVLLENLRLGQVKKTVGTKMMKNKKRRQARKGKRSFL